jgi:hypothetical protein
MKLRRVLLGVLNAAEAVLRQGPIASSLLLCKHEGARA